MLLNVLFSLVSAQNCSPDLLVDDFKSRTLQPLVIEEAKPLRFFNKLGGDYGIKEQGNSKIDVVPDADGGYMEILASWGPEDTSESEVHPGKPNSRNYWYVKFDKYACFDLSSYTAIQFDLVAPADAEMTFVMTQRASDCKVNQLNATRKIDSEYQPLSKYITPNGKKQTVTIPLADFAKNVIGGDFDMQHLKDFTIIDIKPNDFKFQLSQFMLIGNCQKEATPTISSSETASPTSTNAGEKINAGKYAVLLVIITALL